MNNFALRETLIKEIGIPQRYLSRLILRAPHTYKVYTIPKKDNDRRTIAQPAKETKYIQHWLMKNVFHLLPVHRCATAYKPGGSIKLNAGTHASNSFIAKFDFKDFFTSIKAEYLKMHLVKHLGSQLSSEDVNDILRISCIKYSNKNDMCLSIGAPCSPMLSNSIMYEFDEKVSKWCSENGVTYTRYADDLTFSTNTPGISAEIEDVIRKIAGSVEYPVIRFNRKKTVHVSKKYQRRVTGLIIDNSGRVSLGRDRKRMISSLVHKYSINLLEEKRVYHLQGLLGFANDAEPLFVARLRGKYGTELIEELLGKRKIKASRREAD